MPSDDHQRRLVQQRVNRRVLAGEIERPNVCPHCDRVMSGRPKGCLRAYIADLSNPDDIDWRCIPCYRKVRPWQPARMPREKLRRCPPYAVMKHDYVTLGMTMREMALKYGAAVPTVEKTLKRRAISHGDGWPLHRELLGRTVNPVGIAHLVREHIQEHYNNKPIVRVPLMAANAWAPYSRISYRNNNGKRTRERRLSMRRATPPSYHDLACGRLLNSEGHAVPTFLIDAIEAEWWGYKPCGKCRVQLQATAFARRHGFERQWMLRLVRDQLPGIERDFARRLLEAIGEPVPAWMQDLAA